MVHGSDSSTTPSRDTNGAATIFRNLDLLRQAASATVPLALGVGEGAAAGGQGAAELVERLGSHPVQPPKLGLADPGELLQPRVPGRGKRAACRAGEIGWEVACGLLVLLVGHGILLVGAVGGWSCSYRCYDAAPRNSSESRRILQTDPKRGLIAWSYGVGSSGRPNSGNKRAASRRTSSRRSGHLRPRPPPAPTAPGRPPDRWARTGQTPVTRWPPPAPGGSPCMADPTPAAPGGSARGLAATTPAAASTSLHPRAAAPPARRRRSARTPQRSGPADPAARRPAAAAVLLKRHRGPPAWPGRAAARC